MDGNFEQPSATPETGLAQQFRDDAGACKVGVRQSFVAAVVIVGQTLVIEAEAMEQGRVQVVHREPHQPLAAVIVTIRFLRSTLNFLQRNLAAGVRDVSQCCCRLCKPSVTPDLYPLDACDCRSRTAGLSCVLAERVGQPTFAACSGCETSIGR